MAGPLGRGSRGGGGAHVTCAATPPRPPMGAWRGHTSAQGSGEHLVPRSQRQPLPRAHAPQNGRQTAFGLLDECQRLGGASGQFQALMQEPVLRIEGRAAASGGAVVVTDQRRCAGAGAWHALLVSLRRDVRVFACVLRVGMSPAMQRAWPGGALARHRAAGPRQHRRTREGARAGAASERCAACADGSCTPRSQDRAASSHHCGGGRVVGAAAGGGDGPARLAGGAAAAQGTPAGAAAAGGHAWRGQGPDGAVVHQPLLIRWQPCGSHQWGRRWRPERHRRRNQQLAAAGSGHNFHRHHQRLGLPARRWVRLWGWGSVAGAAAPWAHLGGARLTTAQHQGRDGAAWGTPGCLPPPLPSSAPLLVQAAPESSAAGPRSVTATSWRPSCSGQPASCRRWRA